jgi:hypothetical protein
MTISNFFCLFPFLKNIFFYQNSYANSQNRHLHWCQEGREGDDVACKAKRKKDAKIRHLQKLAKEQKAESRER